ncbi:MAG: NAD(P)/FAD-dependent oxidoreductase, partial [Planctomycetota bacterium]
MAKIYDIAILGATPAGWAAAYRLAGKGLDVIVVSAPSQAVVECPLTDWAPRELFKLDALPEDLHQQAHAEDFRRVYYHNAPLERSVDYLARQTAGSFIPYRQLNRAMKAAATGEGAKFRIADRLPDIRLAEDRVHLGGPLQIQAQFLLIAQSRPADIIGDLALPMRTVPYSSLVVAGLDVPIPNSPPKELEGAMHVVEMPERSELGMYYQAGGMLHLRVISSSSAAGNRANELSNMVAGLQAKELVGQELTLNKAQGAVWHPPAGVAMELETHVAKRCVLVGTAGGFCESITGHTLYPSVRTALLAADVAERALNSNTPQDTLMEFKQEWRNALADYLRPPNTSLHMLLPLLFANERIVSKFTRALLYG